MSVHRILLVDDLKEFVEDLAVLFRMEGWQADTATSGEEAIQAFSPNTYEAVVLDLNMPGMDGMETLRKLRNIDPNVCAVMLTGYGNVPRAVEGLQLGAKDFIEKGIRIGELAVKVENAIFRKRREAAERARQEVDVLLTFIGTVSHDLKGKIGGIGAAADVLLVRALAGDSDGARARLKSIDSMLGSAKHSLERFSRLAVHRQFKLGETSLDTAIALGVKEVVTSLNAARVTPPMLEVEKGLSVHGNLDFVADIVENAVENAYAACSKITCPEIKILVRKDLDKAVIEVLDNGCGVPSTVLEHLDRPGKPESNTPGGWGFGTFAMCKLAEWMGGHFALENRAAGGAVARIELPLYGQEKERGNVP